VIDLVSTTPTNWGAVLLSRTGSTQHNIGLCSHAFERGMKFKPYVGVVKKLGIACGGAGCTPVEEILARRTEEEIYGAPGGRRRKGRCSCESLLLPCLLYRTGGAFCEQCQIDRVFFLDPGLFA
jgi:hypothetical protein